MASYTVPQKSSPVRWTWGALGILAVSLAAPFPLAAADPMGCLPPATGVNVGCLIAEADAMAPCVQPDPQACIPSNPVGLVEAVQACIASIADCPIPEIGPRATVEGCNANAENIDEVHDLLCLAAQALPNLPSSELGGQPTSKDFQGDDDEDGRADYVVYSIHAADPTGATSDGCGVQGTGTTTSFDGASCLDGEPLLKFHVRIDVNPGTAPVAGPIVILENRLGVELRDVTFPDGRGLSAALLAIQDPRRDIRYHLVSDVDNDGDVDFEEAACLSNPTNPASTCNDPDADGDDAGRPNGDGGTVDTSPQYWDTDEDGLADDDDPWPVDPRNGDQDTDLLPDGIEATCATDSQDPDTDDDGLLDGLEAGLRDEEGPDGPDGIPDAGFLICDSWSSPTEVDTDGDGQSDGPLVGGDGAIVAGPDPFPKDAFRRDLDLDGLMDHEETGAAREGGGGFQYCSKRSADGPSRHRDGTDGPDSDSEPDVCPEGGYEGTDPADADSDDDYLVDGYEVIGYGRAPDGTCALDPAGVQSDPRNPDTDADGFYDRTEVCDARLVDSDPTDSSSQPDAGAARQVLIGSTPSCTTVAIPGICGPVGPPCGLIPLPYACQPVGGIPSVGEVLLNPRCEAISATEDPDCQGHLLGPTLDGQDPYDIDDDGIVFEPNGQVDFIERLLLFDPDETGAGTESTLEHNSDLEGRSGATIVVRDVIFTGMAPEKARIHFADAGAVGPTIELVVVEEGPRSRPASVSCIYLVGQVLHVAVANAGRGFDSASAEPCGPGSPWGFVNAAAATLEPYLFLHEGEWFRAQDTDGDGIPNSVRVTLPQPLTCSPTTVKCEAGPAATVPGLAPAPPMFDLASLACIVPGMCGFQDPCLDACPGAPELGGALCDDESPFAALPACAAHVSGCADEGSATPCSFEDGALSPRMLYDCLAGRQGCPVDGPVDPSAFDPCLDRDAETHCPLDPPVDPAAVAGCLDDHAATPCQLPVDPAALSGCLDEAATTPCPLPTHGGEILGCLSQGGPCLLPVHPNVVLGCLDIDTSTPCPVDDLPLQDFEDVQAVLCQEGSPASETTPCSGQAPCDPSPGIPDCGLPPTPEPPLCGEQMGAQYCIRLSGGDGPVFGYLGLPYEVSFRFQGFSLHL